MHDKLGTCWILMNMLGVLIKLSWWLISWFMVYIDYLVNWIIYLFYFVHWISFVMFIKCFTCKNPLYDHIHEFCVNIFYFV